MRRALPGGATPARPARSGSAYLRALGPAAEAGGKLPDLPASIAAAAAAGWLCVCARGRSGAGRRVCARRAGGVRRAPPVSGRRGRRRPQLREAHRWLRGPDASRAPLDPRAPGTEERQPRAPQPAGAGAGAEPRLRGAGPALGARGAAAERQLPRLPPPRGRRPDSGEATACRGDPLSPRLEAEPTPFPDHSHHFLDDRLVMTTLLLPGRRQGAAYGDLPLLGALGGSRPGNDPHFVTRGGRAGRGTPGFPFQGPAESFLRLRGKRGGEERNERRGGEAGGHGNPRSSSA